MKQVFHWFNFAFCLLLAGLGVLSVVRDPGCGSIRVRGGPGPAVCRFAWLEDTGIKRETYIPDALCYTAEPDHYRDFCPDLPDHIYPAVAPGTEAE